MINAKLTFQKNQPLRDQWAAVCKADWFAEVLIAARAQFIESPASEDQIVGMRRYEDILLSMTDVDQPRQTFARSGLKHDRHVEEQTKPT
jgi:hypothetical protein